MIEPRLFWQVVIWKGLSWRGSEDEIGVLGLGVSVAGYEREICAYSFPDFKTSREQQCEAEMSDK